AGTWYDFESGIGGGVWELLELKGGMIDGVATDWLKSEFGIEIKKNGSAASRIVAIYDYVDENGTLLFQVCRLEPESFRQRRPDGAGGGIWSVKGIRPGPYPLPEPLAGRSGWVFVVEGEKDADRLASLGLVATCNAGGAGKWCRDFARYFEGVHVVVLPDNDQAGRDHARDVAASLSSVAAQIRIVE